MLNEHKQFAGIFNGNYFVWCKMLGYSGRPTHYASHFNACYNENRICSTLKFMFTPFCWVIQLITMIAWKIFESMVVSPGPEEYTTATTTATSVAAQPEHRIHMELKITVAEIAELLTLTFVLLKFYLIVVIYYSIKKIGPSRRARVSSQPVPVLKQAPKSPYMRFRRWYSSLLLSLSFCDGLIE